MPIRSPAPRIARSSSAMRNPSSVSRIVVSRRRAGFVQAAPDRAADRSRPPRPARPGPATGATAPGRSVSACSITMIVALGTFTPTSITVVATRTERLPRHEPRHRGVLVGGGHLAVHQPDPVPQGRAQDAEPLLGAGIVHHLGFLDQRADPIGLPPLGHRLAQMLHHLVQPLGRHHRRADRLSPRRFFVQHRDIHVAMRRQRQAARDRRRGHHQHIDRRALGPQLHPLRHAEAVLFVHHRQPQVLERHILLKDRMGADQDRRSAPSPGPPASSPGRPPGRGPSAVPAAPPPPGPAGASPSKCWRARISVGAIITPCPPASTAISRAWNATSVLPDPTSPCKSRFIRKGCRHVGRDLGHRADLRAGGRDRAGFPAPWPAKLRRRWSPPPSPAADEARAIDSVT